MKKIWIYDLEVFPKIFTATFIHKDTDEKRVFVINKDIDDRNSFFNFLLNEISGLVGYNNLHYDSQIIEYFIKNPNSTTEQLRAYSDLIIYGEDKRPDYPEWKLTIPQLDLFKTLSLSVKAKRTGLKWCEFGMDAVNIEDMPKELTLENVLYYNENDVLATKKLYHDYYHEIELRKSLTDSEGVNLMNSTEPDMAKKLFLHYLSEATGIPKKELQEYRTERSLINVKDIIFPYIKFNTERFNLVLNAFNGLQLTPGQDFEFSIPYQGINIDYGLGGLHAAPKNVIVKTTDTHTLKTVDATSYYPHLAFQNGLCPAHLPKDIFLDLYKGFYLKRKVIPKTNPKNYILKILLNASYGLMNDKFSFLKDPLVGLTICVNGQLLLSMLVEEVTTQIPNSKVIMINTDGCEFLIPNEDIDKYMAICEWWEKLTTIPLEHDTYSKMVISDVNNYIGVFTNGKDKRKGKFEFENIPLHKNKSHSIIPLAVFNHFVNDIPIEKTIKEHTNIFDFCAGVKAGSSPEKGKSKFVLYQVTDNVLTRQSLSKIVRYFVSKKGGYLIKEYSDGSTAQVEAPLMNGKKLIKEWKVTYFNKSYQIPIKEYNIDYSYYIYKAREIIEAIEQKNQLKLL
jgi:hypothetical protein